MNLQELRGQYTDYNKRHISERVGNDNNVMEQWIIATMNHHGVEYDGLTFNNWAKCSKKDDMKNKKDLFATVNGKEAVAQIKWRQPNSGTDIQVAVIQPFGNSSLMRDALKTAPENFPFWARDWKFEGDLYAVLDNAWENLMIVKYGKVKSVVRKILKEWVASGASLGPTARCYIPDDSNLADNGVQLRFTSDKGKRSFDSGEGKMLCYIPPKIFTGNDITILKMVDMPEEKN
jgi:hypothetical protein